MENNRVFLLTHTRRWWLSWHNSINKKGCRTRWDNGFQLVTVYEGQENLATHLTSYQLGTFIFIQACVFRPRSDLLNRPSCNNYTHISIAIAACTHILSVVWAFKTVLSPYFVLCLGFFVGGFSLSEMDSSFVFLEGPVVQILQSLSPFLCNTSRFLCGRLLMSKQSTSHWVVFIAPPTFLHTLLVWFCALFVS